MNLVQLGQNKKTTRILIVCDRFPPPWNGGDTTVANLYYQVLCDLSFNVLVLTTNTSTNCDNSRVLRYLSSKEKWTNNLDALKKSLYNDKRKAENVLKTFNPDIILFLHIWGLSGELIRWFLEQPQKKIFRFGDECYKLHILKPLSKRRQGWLKEPPGKIDSSLIIVNSQLLRSRLSEFTKSRILFLPNPVKVAQINDPPKSLNLLYVGRVVEYKGVKLCLQIAEELSLKYDVKLDIVGPDEFSDYYKSLQNEFSNLIMEGVVNWLGTVSNEAVYQYYSNTKFVLFTSTWRNENRTIEGCPNSILEAWAAGRLLISSNNAGHEEFLKHNINCHIVKSDNVKDWAESILFYHKNSDKYSEIINNAFKNLSVNHSYDDFRKKMLDNINEVCSGEIN